MSERQSPDKADVNKAMMYWHERAMAAEKTRDELAEALRMFVGPGIVTGMTITKAKALLARLDAEKEPK